MAGQVPAISLGAQCHPKRCHRDKPGYDKSMRTRAGNSKVSRLMEFLTALGQDVRIALRPTRKAVGEMVVG